MDTCGAILLVAAPLFLTGIFLAILRVTRPKPIRISETPVLIHDERDVIYVRQKLQAGSANYEEYYAAHPEKKAADDRFRSLPGLLNPDAPMADTFIYKSVRGSLNTIYSILQQRDGVQMEASRFEFSPEAMSESLKGWCLHFGALSAGICLVEPYHKYSHHGYYELRGVPVNLSHPYAVVFTTEMDFRATMSAPTAPIWLETARGYECGANIATQLAIMIRHMGWSAKAHYFDNYDVIAPLLGRSAGLGEIGRIGILMTPEAGPRVRLAVVTTDMPLVPDKRENDQAVLDFCSRCDKCARCCPAKAIPSGNPTDQPGGRYWRIDHEACYTYWARTGNPCGRCVAVCPLSHPGNVMARTKYDLFRRSYLTQKAALAWDDFRYGRKPTPWRRPRWMLVTPGTDKNKVEASDLSACGEENQIREEDVEDSSSTRSL